MIVISRQFRSKALCLERRGCYGVPGMLLSRKFSLQLQNGVLETQQGDKVVIDCKVSPVTINVTSAWQEHCDIRYDKHIALNVTAETGQRKFTVSLDINKDNDNLNSGDTTPTFQIVVPEIFDVAIQATDAAIKFRNKIMGNLSITSNSGSVCIDHFRGEHISVQCNNASLEVKKKLEGCLTITCKSLAAQMIHGSTVDISAQEDVKIKALYSVNSYILSSGGQVDVGLSHGHTTINSALSCSLNGIDGSFIVNSTDGATKLQINKLYPGSESVAVSRNGSISTFIDPDVVTNLHCSTRDEDCIEIDSDGFISETLSCTARKGIFSGHSTSIKRPLSSSRSFKRKSGGKIDVDSAALLSLRNTTKAEDSSFADHSLPSDTLPSLSLLAKSGIIVESVSWIGKILKKYDM